MLPELRSSHDSLSKHNAKGYIVLQASHKTITGNACRSIKLLVIQQVGSSPTIYKGDFLSHPVQAIVNVDGNNATIWVVWTGFINEDIKGAPKILEQGTVFDELVKVKGQWLIKKRYITADSGLSTGDWPNYKPRSFR